MSRTTRRLGVGLAAAALTGPIFGGAPLFPWCGLFNTGQGCAGSPPAN